MGRFISKDPIGLYGGYNVYAYALNPVGWIDPLGLNKNCPISTTIHSGSQGKHIEGHNNYIEGKSVVTADSQKLLDNYHAGNVTSSRVINEQKVKVDFGEKIGVHKDMNGTSTETSSGIIHSGKKGLILYLLYLM